METIRITLTIVEPEYGEHKHKRGIVFFPELVRKLENDPEYNPKHVVDEIKYPLMAECLDGTDNYWKLTTKFGNELQVHEQMGLLLHEKDRILFDAVLPLSDFASEVIKYLKNELFEYAFFVEARVWKSPNELLLSVSIINSDYIYYQF